VKALKLAIVPTRPWNHFIFVLVGTVLTISFCAVGQEADAPSNRKVINRVVPQYPSLARSLRLSGIVKVEVLVQSNGLVKTVDVNGGHPVLVQSATDAVRKWKWEPATHESRELVEVRFNPE
jgi:TonB family protein